MAANKSESVSSLKQHVTLTVLDSRSWIMCRIVFSSLRFSTSSRDTYTTDTAQRSISLLRFLVFSQWLRRLLSDKMPAKYLLSIANYRHPIRTLCRGPRLMCLVLRKDSSDWQVVHCCWSLGASFVEFSGRLYTLRRLFNVFKYLLTYTHTDIERDCNLSSSMCSPLIFLSLSFINLASYLGVTS